MLERELICQAASQKLPEIGSLASFLRNHWVDKTAVGTNFLQEIRHSGHKLIRVFCLPNIFCLLNYIFVSFDTGLLVLQLLWIGFFKELRKTIRRHQLPLGLLRIYKSRFRLNCVFFWLRSWSEKTLATASIQAEFAPRSFIVVFLLKWILRPFALAIFSWNNRHFFISCIFWLPFGLVLLLQTWLTLRDIN